MAEVEGYITRKSMVYKTGVEYGDYTANYVLGCAHGCRFPCYAYLQKRRFGQISSYEQWCKPFLVSNTLELLHHEIPKLASRIRSVHLCFATDPFMYGYPEVEAMSLDVVRLLNNYGLSCTTLTKGILPETLSDCSRNNAYGITLVSLSEEFRAKMEPGTAPYVWRVDALKRLHDHGCRTWVSMEPYPTPNLIEQNLEEILDAVGFVDRIIFGRTNYSTAVSHYPGYREFYNRAAQQVELYCAAHGIDCYIKKGTVTVRDASERANK